MKVAKLFNETIFQQNPSKASVTHPNRKYSLFSRFGGIIAFHSTDWRSFV